MLYRETQGKWGRFIYPVGDQYVGKSLSLYGQYSESEVELCRSIIKEGMVVVEVGSNIGALTVPMGRFVGTKGLVVCFEPQRLLFQLLCANLALNDLAHIRMYNYACGDEEKEIMVSELDPTKPNNWGGYSIEKIPEGLIKLKVQKLDNFLETIPAIHFLKLDVEGMEEKVLRGGSSLIEKHRPLLYVENDRKELSSSLLNYLESIKYRSWWHMPPLYAEDNHFEEKLNVFKGTVSCNILSTPAEREVKIEGLREAGDPDWWPM